MLDRVWKILLVEDDEDDLLLTRSLLKNEGRAQFELDWTPDYDIALERIRGEAPDVVLVDYRLGMKNGLELIREAIEQGYRGAAILLTGHGDYELDIEAMHAGAVDYLVKSEVTARLLERTIRYAVERTQTEEILRRAKQELELRVQERTRAFLKAIEELQNEITERKRVEAELAEVQRRLIDNVEIERLQIAQDLHDGPMQDLYALTYQADALFEALPEGKRNENLRSFQNQIQQVIHNLRAIAGELRPPALVPFGLEKAVRSHAERFQKGHNKIDVYLNLMPDGQMLNEQVRLALFRIYQVAMVNVVRHSEATRVEINLRLDEHEVVLEIIDNGCGFQVPTRWIDLVRQGHLGLTGATERAEAIGGTLEVRSTPGTGTLIRVKAPYR
ncbi:MAG: response regulator [Chloroflexi bacterium]|jgi:signal transduction histidine kinase|nr:response regulator [Anaerolineaceae bacterium]NMB89336.1 response regulator [Chloroflexota bacterium]